MILGIQQSSGYRMFDDPHGKVLEVFSIRNKLMTKWKPAIIMDAPASILHGLIDIFIDDHLVSMLRYEFSIIYNGSCLHR